eukprot:9499122-Alexandrium_andersonii.AAC.1
MSCQQPTAPATGSRRLLVLRPSRESLSQLSDEPASQTGAAKTAAVVAQVGEFQLGDGRKLVDAWRGTT